MYQCLSWWSYALEVILAYAATITIRLVFFVEAAAAEFYQQIPTGILILMSSTWGQNCI